MIIDPTSDKLRIFIVVPTHEMVPYKFALALANMIGYTIHSEGDKVDIATLACAGTYVHRARQELINQVAQEGAHLMLWLDSDHDFPKESLVHLINRLQTTDADMIGINYTTRRMPLRYVAIKKTAYDQPDQQGEHCKTLPDSVGIEEVEALGFGMVLMKTSIIPTLPKNDPLFFFIQDDAENHHVGEDVYFCRLVRQAGWKIYVDHDLSKYCTHIGQQDFRLEHLWAIEEAQENGDNDVLGTQDGGGGLAEPVGRGESGSDVHPVGGEPDEEGSPA